MSEWRPQDEPLSRSLGVDTGDMGYSGFLELASPAFERKGGFCSLVSIMNGTRASTGCRDEGDPVIRPP